MANFLKKLGFGLKKSSEKINQGLADVFTKRKLDEETLTALEDALIEADLGVHAGARLIEAFGNKRFEKDVSPQTLKEALALEIEKLLEPLEATFSTEKARPYVVLAVGVNGAGKTTTIGKLATKLIREGKQVSFIAADTFRAAAVEQLVVWGKRAGARVFTGAPNADSAGLCFDGLKAALQAGDDVVFIDTAGRLQNKNGLMDELQKSVRVIQKVLPEAPHLTLLTLDATTGQNAVSQVQIFKEIAHVDGLVITKLDGSAKGGILAEIATTCPTPVYFVGVGEQIDDLDVFCAKDYARSLLGL